MSIEAELATLGQVGVAVLLGGVVGFERESQNKPAGLRTHMMVAGASCMLVVLARDLTGDMVALHGTEVVRSDPIRALVAVMTGVGFLGAGTIVSHRNEVHGLTTAGSLLMVSSIGVAVAAERWILATTVAIGLVLVLYIVGRLERRSRGRDPDTEAP